MPIFFKRLVVLMRAHVDKASWQLLFMATLIHMSVTWGLLWLSNETALLPLSTFFLLLRRDDLDGWVWRL